MSAGSIVILPGGEPIFGTALAQAIAALGGQVFRIDTSAASAAPISVLLCAQIHHLDPSGPLVVVAPTNSVAHLPAIALAQRTAHRRVNAYYLIDPSSDPTGPEWPDAPVYITRVTGIEQSRQPALRGWLELEFVDVEGLALSLISLSNDN